MSLDTLEDVLHEQVKDLISAEQQLVTALPKMAEAASSDELKQAIREHLEETRGHVDRLERVAAQLGIDGETTCKAMQGLVAEGDEIAAKRGDPAARDAALIGAAQRVEHYEIAAYGTARTLAGDLGHGDAERLFDETLEEESAADKLLTKIATGGRLGSGINEKAATQSA
jgi:ferritin-like metal-binding protein YciE